MKRLILACLTLFFLGTLTGEAQILKKIRKRAEKAAEEAVLDKVEEKTNRETEKTMDTILEAPGRKARKKRKGSSNEEVHEDNSDEEYYKDSPGYEDHPDMESTTDPEIEVYSKFDFVPGDKLLFQDDFALDFVGDFPAKWNTNGSGEIVTAGPEQKKWLEMKPGYGIVYIPDVLNLPEEYTIEFDLMALGLDQQTSSTAVLKVGVSDNTNFKWGKYATVDIPFCQYHPVGFFVRNGGAINNSIQGDVRENMLGQPHISIAVNNQRFRLWVDEGKYVDIPRMIPEESKPSAIKFELLQFQDGKERLFLTNLKVAEGGVDLRRKLLAEGMISTNGILFNSGSAQIKPQSMGIIRQISQVLQQEASMSLRIIGHTDSDGDESQNLELSQRRATAVKNVLTDIYGIDPASLETDGKGEYEPVGDNTTPEGKAQNRRVEFIKL